MQKASNEGSPAVKRAALAVGLLMAGAAIAPLATPASAADLGGDCCADLEERVAELEATTARKGNRKVSLTISGWVANQIMWYDNGPASNAYVTGIGSTLNSHVTFTGAAQITKDWNAGYVLQLETGTSDPLTAGNTAFNAEGPSGLHIVKNHGAFVTNSVDVLYSYWFLKSDQLGKVSVGSIPQSSSHAAALVDGSGSLIPANWAPLDGMAINLARHGRQLQLPATGFPQGALMWCGTTQLPLAGDCNGVPLNGIRYDSPTFGGFSVSASWGEDDFWDVTGNYAGQFGGFKFATAVSYLDNRDENNSPGFNDAVGLSAFNPLKTDAQYLQIGAYLEHVPTGLFVYGAYGKEWNNNVYNPATLDTAFAAGTAALVTANQPSGDNWYIKAGMREKWTPLGHTVLYGEYGDRQDMFHEALTAFGVDGSDMTQWGLGAVQEIDAAAMSLWVNFKQYQPTLSGPGSATPGYINNGGESLTGKFDNINVFTAGALISF
ncbi:MAG: porin [Proteobacteria bacterium]|nr:porin [Pseudomonadota bacterium]